MPADSAGQACATGQMVRKKAVRAEGKVVAFGEALG
jgi:hypothetical protein